MSSIANILLNFSEIRRPSIKLWSGIPDEYINWKPDKDAFTYIDMIRHIFEGEHIFHKIVVNRCKLGNYKSPWNGNKYIELDFAENYRTNFTNMISNLNKSDLDTIRIERKEVGQSKTLGDYLNRIAYHESVHTGQLLSYLRTIGIDRPQLWD
jgi:uncharacterized damage-inducible protein DinB